MSVKKRRSKNFDLMDQEEDEGEAWLLSYADLMTLLACFFILMMAFANYEPVKFGDKAEEVSKSFKKDNYKSAKTKLENLQEEIENHSELKKMTSTSIRNDELEINFRSNILFSSGGAKLNENVLQQVDGLIELIAAKDPNYRVIVEGHTDDGKIISNKYSSNWSLSGARAASVVERFEYYGFNPSDLKLLGLGSTKPMLPNRDENGKEIIENQILNRRVVIKVLIPSDIKKKIKLGFGVYFDGQI